MKLDRIKAIVTGGASGLGFGTAKYLIAQGAKVALFDVGAEKGARAAAELGASARYFQTDVTSEEQVAANTSAAGRVLGREGPMPSSAFETAIKINLIGSFNVAKAAADAMQHNAPDEDGERGAIIFTASIAAYEGQIGQAAYAASKGGIVGMTLPMAREFARFGVRVMTVAPGVFDTPMVGGMPQKVHDSLCEQVPYPSRLGRVEEFADAVAFILQNRYMNGSVIRLDGAIRLAAR